jgi:hypothetical protein
MYEGLSIIRQPNKTARYTILYAESGAEKESLGVRPRTVLEESWKPIDCNLIYLQTHTNTP